MTKDSQKKINIVLLDLKKNEMDQIFYGGSALSFYFLRKD